VLDACLTILEQHKELYGWYVRVKDTIPLFQGSGSADPTQGEGKT
jgi:hypothetical protein